MPGGAAAVAVHAAVALKEHVAADQRKTEQRRPSERSRDAAPADLPVGEGKASGVEEEEEDGDSWLSRTAAAATAAG